MNKYLGHFKTIVKHKWYVFNSCRKSGIVWRGLTHDLSKLSFTEFVSSAKFFSGVKSPIAAQKEKYGYSVAWANHKGKNTHHWEHWVDWTHGELYCMKMPIADVKELLCDWIGAGKAYNKAKWSAEEAPNYYYDRRENMLFHSETRELIEESLMVLKLEGEIKYYEYIKELTYEK